DTRDVVATTAAGRVRGVVADGVNVFKGIPYGASTAGKNRFMPPVKPAPWTEVRDALAYGPTAPQVVGRARRGVPAEGEDCLVLNVWTPALGTGRGPPVMACLHGARFSYATRSPPI